MRLVEGRGAVGGVGASSPGAAVRQREAELGGDELLEVWTADVRGLLDLSDLQDLLVSTR